MFQVKIIHINETYILSYTIFLRSTIIFVAVSNTIFHKNPQSSSEVKYMDGQHDLQIFVAAAYCAL
jgi:hypothetical protein